MKKIKNLLIALFTLFTVSSFATTTYVINYNTTTNVTCMIGDTLKFYGTVGSAYGVQINGVTKVAPHVVSSSPYYIGYYVIVGGETNFTILTGVNWNGTITVQTATSVKDFTKNTTTNLIAFPNPSNGEFKIKFNTNKEKVDVVIYDIQGRLVHQENTNTILGENILDINTNFASGIYIVKVEDKTFKITVTK